MANAVSPVRSMVTHGRGSVGIGQQIRLGLVLVNQ